MLRWRLLGISFCIEPSFWLINALWAYMLFTYYPPSRGDLTLLPYVLTWVGCILVSILVHELGHVITGRIFGQPGNITVSGLGGQAMGSYEKLRPWQRILVAFAGPLAGFLFVGLVVCLDSTDWDLLMRFLKLPSLEVNMMLIRRFDPLLPFDRPAPYGAIMILLLMINLFVNIMNLFPIIPMDGGMIFKESCNIVAGDTGVRFAFGCSFLFAAAFAVYLGATAVQNYTRSTWPVPLFYPFMFPELSAIIFALMAWRCLQMWRQLGAMQRHSEYADYD